MSFADWTGMVKLRHTTEGREITALLTVAHTAKNTAGWLSVFREDCAPV